MAFRPGKNDEIGLFLPGFGYDLFIRLALAHDDADGQFRPKAEPCQPAQGSLALRAQLVMDFPVGEDDV